MDRQEEANSRSSQLYKCGYKVKTEDTPDRIPEFEIMLGAFKIRTF